MAKNKAPSKADKHAIVIWTIYDNPKDYPGQFVARRWSVVGGSFKPTPDQTPIVKDSLSKIRGELPEGLVKLDRYLGDDPCIVECWI